MKLAMALKPRLQVNNDIRSHLVAAARLIPKSLKRDTRFQRLRMALAFSIRLKAPKSKMTLWVRLLLSKTACRMHMTSSRLTSSRIHIPAMTRITLRDLQMFFKCHWSTKVKVGRF